jgi:hypothetical protein
MKTKALLAVAALGIGLGVKSVAAQATAPAPADSAPTAASIADMQARLNAMQAKLDAIQANQAEAEADRTAVIKQVLADADAQSELSSGYDPNVGFVIRSGDGAFSFHPGAVLDFRNMTSYRESIPVKGGGETGKTGYDTQNGFDITRARFTFDGNYTKDI